MMKKTGNVKNVTHLTQKLLKFAGHVSPIVHQWEISLEFSEQLMIKNKELLKVAIDASIKANKFIANEKKNTLRLITKVHLIL